MPCAPTPLWWQKLRIPHCPADTRDPNFLAPSREKQGLWRVPVLRLVRKNPPHPAARVGRVAGVAGDEVDVQVFSFGRSLRAVRGEKGRDFSERCLGEKFAYREFQRSEILVNRYPDDFRVYPEILVDQLISHGSHLIPGKIRVPVADLSGNLFAGLPNISLSGHSGLHSGFVGRYEV
jgi:hypothetical protein